MATPHERHRNNVKAGIFMTIAIALTLVVIAILKDAWADILTPRNTYAITFRVADGISALAPGSAVRVGGLEMGSVEGVELLGVGEPPPSAVEEGAAYELILVTIELDNRVPLYSNASAFVKGSLIGADAWVEITSIGHPTDRDGDGLPDGAIIQPDDLTNPLEGRDAGTMLAALLGPDGAASTQSILRDFEAFTPFLATLPQEYQDNLRPTLVNLNQASMDIQELAAKINDDEWPAWAQAVTSILTYAENAAAGMELLMQDGRLFMADANAGVAEVRDMVSHNRPGVDAFVENLNQASADARLLADRLANDTMDRIDALLDRGMDGLDSFARLGASMEQEFDIISPQLRDAMASVSNAANELALGTTEIRHSPWRLLYRPSTEELEYENLYFAATKFALAASELKVASQSMERAVANSRAFLDRNPEKLEELQENIAASYQRYEQAQRDLLDIIAQQ